MEQPIKKLYRSKTNRVVAGVAGGIGEYFNVDPVLIRIIFVALALINGLGVLIYLVFLFIVPNEQESDNMAEKIASISAGLKKSEEKLAGKIKEWTKSSEVKKTADEVLSKDISEKSEKLADERIKDSGESWFKDKKRVVGFAVVIVGAISLLNTLFDVSWFRWNIFWPTALIIVGFYLTIRKNKS